MNTIMTPDYLPEILLLVAVLVAGALLYRMVGTWWRNLRMKMRFRRGRAGEEKARKYLLRHGFTILAEQATLKPAMIIGGERRKYDVRADFIVRKKGRRSVVEAKTGAAARPWERATRRQLLEYAMNYDVDGVYLYDGNKDSLVEVDFGTHRVPSRCCGRLVPWVVGFACGVATAALVLLR
jgi:Holliday junction resolvase-like predicted endonuclease